MSKNLIEYNDRKAAAYIIPLKEAIEELTLVEKKLQNLRQEIKQMQTEKESYHEKSCFHRNITKFEFSRAVKYIFNYTINEDEFQKTMHNIPYEKRGILKKIMLSELEERRNAFAEALNRAQICDTLGAQITADAKVSGCKREYEKLLTYTRLL